MKTFFHVFDNCTQDWFTVASIVEVLLVTLNEIYPQLTEAFLRSDNAGCYHCAPLMLAIPDISKRTKIVIRRYDFSDAQAGKDICDRLIACAKCHMHRYVNEGKNINTASDMKRALDSYGGVKGCRASVVSTDTSKQKIFKHSWTGITSFNNFEFLNSGIRVWRAYKIGKGKLIKQKEMKQMSITQDATGIIRHEAFSTPKCDAGLWKHNVKQCQSASEDNSNENEEASKGFHCPDVCCVKVFLSSGALERHLDIGKHCYQLQTESTYDTIRRKWASRCTSVGIPHFETSLSCSGQSQEETSDKRETSSTCEMGWALKKKSPNVRFSKAVKDFLVKTFIDGETSGIKADPKEVSAQMRSVRKRQKRLFDKSEWLTTQQVKSYFSRLSVQQRKGCLKQDKKEEQEEEDDHDEEEEDIEMMEEAMRRDSMLTCIREELEL